MNPTTPQLNPDAFKSLLLAAHPDAVASDGRKYSDIPALELTQKAVANHPDGVTNAGVKYSDYLQNTPTASQGFGEGTNSKAPGSSGLFQDIVRGVVKPVARLGTNLVNAGQTVLGKPQTQPFSSPFMGDVTPVGQGFDSSKFVGGNIAPLKDAIGTGASIASNIVGGEGAGAVAEQGAKGLLTNAVITGAKQGAIAGGLQGLGSSLSANKNLGDTLLNTGVGGIEGGAVGGALGGVSGGIGILGQKLQSLKANKEIADTVGNHLASFANNLPDAQAMDTNGASKLLAGNQEDLALQLEYQGHPAEANAIRKIDMSGIDNPEDYSKAVNDAIDNVKQASISPKLNKVVQNTIDNRVSTLQKIEDGRAPIRNYTAKQTAKGIDVKGNIANTDLLKDSVDSTGTLRTKQPGGAIDQYNEFIKPQEDIVSKILAKEGKTIPLADVKTQMTDAVNNSNIKGSAKATAMDGVKKEINGLKLDTDAQGNIPIATIHQAKVSKYANINYMNPESGTSDKLIAKTLKDIVEKNTTSANVKALNAELSQHYANIGYLEKLDGAKVAGGKLGKYFAKTIGGMVGSHFGPLGTIAGAEVGGRLSGATMESQLSKGIGKNLESSQAMKDALTATQSLKKEGPLQANQATTAINTKNSISPKSTIPTLKTYPNGDTIPTPVKDLPNLKVSPTSNQYTRQELLNRYISKALNNSMGADEKTVIRQATQKFNSQFKAIPK